MDDLGVPNWLKQLPLAPEFYPTDTEFADPIAYISKIEKEASAFGICKVIPPLPKPSKKFVFANLNKSLSKAPELVSDGNRRNEGEFRAVFTTRHQELGHGLKRAKGLGPVKPSSVHKQVWQSGEVYTLDQFESKAKVFARNQLATVKDVSPLGIETLFWKAASEKAIYIEYANDVPGSGFGELEEPFQYFHRRRRKRKFDQKCQPSPNCENWKLDTTSNSHVEDSIVQSDLEQSLETGKQSPSLLNLASDESSRFSRQSNAGTSKEGTAGWKLSNSPWNLQVISRSPGSLTRFMLDDIPGVTSPMVYIGMLFSWFAWHVEDHELHSLNFLHTGSPKTWYAVPGDYAFDFEEVIRSKGYEGNLDRLAALTLLGEKTNLLSPEAVVASGIPCCRLVQNPGEYVVTFPRAYHVGFSHGFNCGEAANFGTSQWLKVAKEAAVRRAAMNYLPMLSHQQLLYMLTMSFVSRVPRTLLPGARSSRLRDRQKEEREQVVKKAFIDDMLKENDLLLALFEKESTFCAVLWDPESLSSPSKDSRLFSSPANMDVSNSLVEENNIDISNHEEKISSNAENEYNDISNASTVSIGRSSLFESKYGDSCNSHTDRARPHRGKLEDFYMEYDDLPCGLHVDSGTLACVACGILGFPFMAIVQPSLRASEELFPADNQALQETLGSLKPPAPSYPDDAVSNSASDPHNPVPDLSQVSKDSPRHPSSKIGKIYQWNTSNGFLRPRIFCLEHALETEELLHSKGGANVLIICHSAYPKIKAHALAVAEEICAPFHYSEVPLEDASQQDLNLINISIDDEEQNECSEDWTSRLGINLQYHVKLRKLSPLKHEQHVLALGGLFSGIISESDISTLKWTSRRSRTPIKVNPSQSKPSGATHIEKGNLLTETSERNKFNGANKVMQYSRRSSNRKRIAEQHANSKPHGHLNKHQDSEVSAVKQASDSGISKDILCSNENANGFIELSSSLTANCESQHEHHTSEQIGELSKVSDPPNFTTSLAIENRENDLELDNFHHVGSSRMELEVSTIDEAREASEISEQANSKCSAAIVSMKSDSTEFTNSHDVEKHKICTTEEASGTSEASEQANFAGSPSMKLIVGVDHTKVQMEDRTMERDYMEEETACNVLTRDSSMMTHEIITPDKSFEKIVLSEPRESPASQTAAVSITGNSTAQSEKKIECGVLHDSTAGLSNMEQVNQMEKETDEACTCCSVNLIDQLSDSHIPERTNMEAQACSPARDPVELRSKQFTIVDGVKPTKRDRNKLKRELEQMMEDKISYDSFIRSPCEGLRPRNARFSVNSAGNNDIGKNVEETTKNPRKKTNMNISVPRKENNSSTSHKEKIANMNTSIHKCEIEGCRMSFKTRSELLVHKRNRCTYDGCGKRFRSHKYTMLHLRVHADERPLKCPWKGCKMSFKWAWARTEHLRVHTGERPYECKFDGCGLTFRFVSDYSRHRRRTGHYVN